MMTWASEATSRATPCNNPDDISVLWADYKQTGSSAARESLMIHYMTGHVRRVAQVVVSRGSKQQIDCDDLAQHVYPSLLRIIDRYNPNVGVRFETYSFRWLAGVMVAYVRRNRARFGEVAESVCDPRAINLISTVDGDDFRQWISRGLPQRDKMILALYYYEQMTMKEVGETLGVSESRVAQRLASIINVLRARLCPKSITPVYHPTPVRASAKAAPRIASGRLAAWWRTVPPLRGREAVKS